MDNACVEDIASTYRIHHGRHLESHLMIEFIVLRESPGSGIPPTAEQQGTLFSCLAGMGLEKRRSTLIALLLCIVTRKEQHIRQPEEPLDTLTRLFNLEAESLTRLPGSVEHRSKFSRRPPLEMDPVVWLQVDPGKPSEALFVKITVMHDCS